MQEDSKPKLSLVASEGKQVKDKSKRSGKASTGGELTEKQLKFTEALAAGATNAEAYRLAYDASGMSPNTIYSEACKLAASPKIATKLAALLAEKKGRNSMEAEIRREKNSERVWRGVWRLAENIDGNVPPAVQQSSLALAAKMAGMLTEQVKIENVSADASAIEKELVERLQRLAKSA
jgi:hypothetical protein